MPMTDAQLALARQKIADQGSSEIQSIILQNATSGTWTITFNGQTTSALPFNAGANAVQNALAALSDIGLGNIGVNNTAPYVLSFGGELAHLVTPMVTVDTTSLPSATATVTEMAQGGRTAFMDSELNANYDLAKANFFLGLYYDIIDLQASTVRLHDYVAGQSNEKRSQVNANLIKLAATYKVLSQADRQIQLASMVPEPPRQRAIPWFVGSSSGLIVGPPFRRPGGWR